MSSRQTVDLSLSVRTKQYLVAGFVCAWLLSVGLAAVRSMTAVPLSLSVPLAVLLWVVLTATWVRRWGGDGDGSVWDAVPRWQYGGRFAGAGGLVRSEQDDALGRSREDE